MSNQWSALFMGDLVVTHPLTEPLFSPSLQQQLTAHDICSCNLEAPIKTASGQAQEKVGPHLWQHAKLPEHLIQASFNLITLANNHIYDFGSTGLQATLEAFAEVKTVGAGTDFETAYALQTFEFHGVKVGCLAYCEAQFGALVDEQLNPAGFAWIHHPLVEQHIQQARQAVDVLLIQVHAGAEFMNIPLPEWRQRYRQFIDLGADAVIGHHPHVPQGWEWYQDKPIFYSLGNAYFDMNVQRRFWEQGLAVSLQFQGTHLHSVNLLSLRKTGNQLTLAPDAAFSDHIEQLSKQLNAPDYLTHANRQAMYLWQHLYQRQYAPSWQSQLKQGLKHFLKGTQPSNAHLIHNLQIETHRWTVLRALHLLQQGRQV